MRSFLAQLLIVLAVSALSLLLVWLLHLDPDCLRDPMFYLKSLECPR